MYDYTRVNPRAATEAPAETFAVFKVRRVQKRMGKQSPGHFKVPLRSWRQAGKLHDVVYPDVLCVCWMPWRSRCSDGAQITCRTDFSLIAVKSRSESLYRVLHLIQHAARTFVCADVLINALLTRPRIFSPLVAVLF